MWAHARLATVHGCLDGANAQRTVRRLLMFPESMTVPQNPVALSAAIEVAGRAEGPLVGGNLRELVGGIGSGLADLRGAIVLLEDRRHVGIGQVDRHLSHLIRSGALDGIVAIALGSFEGFRGYVDQGWTVTDVLRERLTPLGVPILGGLDIGHDVVGPNAGPDQYGVTLGAEATLDTATHALTVSPCVRDRSVSHGG